jgi:hypothetical protein
MIPTITVAVTFQHSINGLSIAFRINNYICKNDIYNQITGSFSYACKEAQNLTQREKTGKVFML